LATRLNQRCAIKDRRDQKDQVGDSKRQKWHLVEEPLSISAYVPDHTSPVLRVLFLRLL
jgi:hypothetical protein